MKEENEDKKELITTDVTANAVQVIKAAILQSQQRALKAINQEQLALLWYWTLCFGQHQKEKLG